MSSPDKRTTSTDTQRGIPAVLSALHHIADQASLVVATYEAAHPDYAPQPAVSR